MEKILQEGRVAKQEALDTLYEMVIAQSINAIEYDSNELPRFRDDIKNALTTLGESDFDLEIGRGGEVEATIRLVEVVKKHMDLLESK